MMNQPPPRVVIFAPYKTGSTALFLALREGWLWGDPYEYFESSQVPDLSHGHPVGALAKVILGGHGRTSLETVQQVAGSTHQIVLVRDPRDLLVSTMLFVVRERPEFYTYPDLRRSFLQTLRKKEAHPDQVSFLSLFFMATGLRALDVVGEMLEGYLEAESHLSGHLVFHYESLVKKDFAALSDFVGFPVDSPKHIPDAFAHVPRTCGSGDWRNWFLQEDVDACIPFLRPYMMQYGYDPMQMPNEHPLILPEVSSGYVERIFKGPPVS